MDEYDEDPHEDCLGIHVGSDGEHYDCDGRPI
ncbi:hypothetical protein FHS44_008116 [Streptosporangium saharense]|uniref:Uncharacterized protein n=1 Tax=Streptosporangium saharense TaxID=1706840 RepID=A0A7W7QWR6_9ACTN|nr:hypothetical protein [Streptosporangium saharense]